MSNAILEDNFDLNAISRALSSISDAAFRGDEGSVDHHKAAVHNEVANAKDQRDLQTVNNEELLFMPVYGSDDDDVGISPSGTGTAVLEGQNLCTATTIRIPPNVMMARARLSTCHSVRRLLGGSENEKERNVLGRDEYGRTPLHEAAMSDPTIMEDPSIAARIVNKLLFYSNLESERHCPRRQHQQCGKKHLTRSRVDHHHNNHMVHHMVKERKKDDDCPRHARTDGSEDDEEEDIVRSLLEDSYVVRAPSYLLSLEKKKDGEEKEKGGKGDTTGANDDDVRKVVVVVLPFFMNPFAVCDAGRTPLHEAARSGNTAVIKALLRGMALITRLKRRVRNSLGRRLRETRENNNNNDNNMTSMLQQGSRASVLKNFPGKEEEDEHESKNIFCTAMVPFISRSDCEMKPRHCELSGVNNTNNDNKKENNVDRKERVNESPAQVSTPNFSSPPPPPPPVGRCGDHGWRWVSQEDSRGRTAIHLAAANGRHEALRFLLRKLQRCSARLQEEQTRMMRGEAVVNDSTFLVERVLMKQDRRGYTALHLAAARGKLECVKVILTSELAEGGEQKKRMGPNSVLFVKGRLGDYALHSAATNGHTEIVRFLVEKMSLLLAKTKDQEENKHFLILARDRVLNARDSLGRTPYFLAASGDWSETMAFLVEIGCDTSIPNNKGKLANA